MRRRISCGLFAIVLILNLVIGYRVYSEESDKHGGDDDVLKQIDTIMHVLQLIRKNYVDIDKVTTKQLLQGALTGMTNCLDPFSCYLPPDELNDLIEETEGEYGGIGITVKSEAKKIIIIAVNEDCPGEKAGLKVNDEIIEVDGEGVTDDDLANSMVRIRGKVGTKVKVKVFRSSTNETLELEAVRATIPLQSVKNAQILNGTDVAYVRITQFMETTAKDLENELKRLENSNPSSLILDLRDNPGGLLESACLVCSLFLPAQKLVVTVKRYGEGKENRESNNFREYFTTDGYKFPDKIRLVILVNNDTASAAEITSGCLRDHKRAILLGSKTYGKGSVQNVVTLGDGSAIKLTVARYYTPDPERPTIDHNGIIPDIEETMSHAEYAKVEENLEANKVDIEEDKQLQRTLEVLKSLNILKR